MKFNVKNPYLPIGIFAPMTELKKPVVDTRYKILLKCYESFCIRGYNETRTDKEIKRLRITKGAFYHYFENKQQLGLAVMDEIIAPMYLTIWKPLENESNPVVKTLIEIIDMHKEKLTPEAIKNGDVLANLNLELSGTDEEFRKKINEITDSIIKIIQDALMRGKLKGELDYTGDAKSLAYYIFGAYQACFGVAKLRNNSETFSFMSMRWKEWVKQLGSKTVTVK